MGIKEYDDAVSEILSAVKNILTDYGWTQGASARNRRGHVVGSESPDAVSFCLDGAINRACAQYGERFEDYARIYIERAINENSAFDDIVPFNDVKGRTKEDVLRVVDAAIAKHREQDVKAYGLV